MAAYYNEIEPYAAAWLRNLIARDLIAPGDVDERSIVEVQPDDLRGYDQCHFFAGIGGWSLALRLAGWSDDRPVWTGSCPCQPFSAAGKQRGASDERHLWPAWFRLISECRPGTVFGEQVAGAAGRAWLDHVLADLEGRDYAAAAAIVPACGVGAPHIRERMWFVADDDPAGCSEQRSAKLLDGQRAALRHDADRCGKDGMDDTLGARLEGHRPDQASSGRDGKARPASAAGWSDLEWLACSDGKARPTQPGLFPLAHGVSGRVGRLRAYGNAIVPAVAAEVIAAYMDIEQ